MKTRLAVKTIALLIVLPFASCRGEPGKQENAGVDTVLIVLGNEPLDDATPTVDTIARVAKAVEFCKKHPATLLLFAGGATVGTNSEARMMADLAVAQGVATNMIRLEERAHSTAENARLTAKLMQEIRPRRIWIVSKSDHLDWAMHVFRREDVFSAAKPLACNVTAADIIAQMKAYLVRHPDNRRVRERLHALENGKRGTD